VCFHGAESTGKSVLAERLRQRFGWPWVPEYGRAYAERHGTHFTMDDLLAMAEGQNAAMLAASDAAPEVLILDTDPLMTAAWAQMLFGAAPEALFAYPKADLYLLFAPDVPWVADGTRFFGTAEARPLCRHLRGYAGARRRALAARGRRLGPTRGAGGGGCAGAGDVNHALAASGARIFDTAQGLAPQAYAALRVVLPCRSEDQIARA
jgi:nicotinamide riboside kinase